jgi:GNAT superfamily N-acetyltransferase
MCERMDQAGVLKMFVARDAGECIGWLSFFVTPSLHYGPTWKQAQHDVFYVMPEFRHGWVWFGLFRYAERELAKMGVRIIYVGDTARRPMGKIYKRMGYELAETYYSKLLNEKATDEVARRSPH